MTLVIRHIDFVHHRQIAFVVTASTITRSDGTASRVFYRSSGGQFSGCVSKRYFLLVKADLAPLRMPAAPALATKATGAPMNGSVSIAIPAVEL